MSSNTVRPFGRRSALAGLFALALLAVGLPAVAQSDAVFPSVAVTTLGGTPIVLPAGIARRTSILVIGFTQASEKQTVVWRKHLSALYTGHAGEVIVYPVVVIQNIPGIFRGLLLAGIRAGVPRGEWEHFLVVSAEESKWKPAIGWGGRDIAYVVLIDKDGRIAWRTSGPYTESAAAALESEVFRLTRAERRPTPAR